MRNQLFLKSSNRYFCFQVLETLEPDHATDLKSLLVFLHTLTSFTGTKTWQVLNYPKGELARPGLNMICNCILEQLVSDGLYNTLKVCQCRFLRRYETVTKCCEHGVTSLTFCLDAAWKGFLRQYETKCCEHDVRSLLFCLDAAWKGFLRQYETVTKCCEHGVRSLTFCLDAA